MLPRGIKCSYISKPAGKAANLSHSNARSRNRSRRVGVETRGTWKPRSGDRKLSQLAYGPMSEGGGLWFVPSRVEGLPDVTRVAVYSDRLEVLSAGQWVVFHFEDIAGWPRPAFLWRR